MRTRKKRYPNPTLVLRKVVEALAALNGADRERVLKATFILLNIPWPK